MMSTIGSRKNAWFGALMLSLVVLIVLFTQHLGPHILGDTPTYLETMDVLDGQEPGAGFMPNRVITTFGAMQIIRAMSAPLGGILNAWFFLNGAFYILAGIFFYKLLFRLFDSRPTAYLGTIFLAANYGFLVFGLNYLMDIGGWSFYIFSLYFLFRYAQTKSGRDLMVSALMVGIGGLFKEYAFLAAIAIAAYLIVENRRNVKVIIVRGMQTGFIALLPVAILYVWAYHRFGYTYADWFGANAEHYIYASRIKEYAKAFGSLLNLLAPLAIGGAYILKRSWGQISGEARIFVVAVAASFLPVLAWPAITQRILTISVPLAVILACFMFKKYERRWYIFLPILAIYIVATFLMDSYLLDAVNLGF